MRPLRTAVKKARWWAGTRRVATVPASGPPRGAALLSYMTEPFFQRAAEASTRHTHFWESWCMAQTLAGMGYGCDVISYHNTSFRPRRRYDVVVDVRRNLERLAPQLPPDCVKMAHLDTANLHFQAEAERRRLRELRERRGVVLRPRRFEPPNRGLEVADAATLIGNDWTLSTYADAAIPLYKVPVTSTVTWDELPARDWETARRSFLWLGSGGMVHKGLDLVLEVFAGRPELSLTVCGPVSAEPDFVDAYRRELYQTPNINTMGWVDVASSAFDHVVRSCGALVYPSCSEGSSGAVVCAMHAGLVPIVTRESGVDLHPTEGVVLRSSSLADIEAAVAAFAQRPPDAVAESARAAWTAGRQRHSRRAFADRYRAVLQIVLGQGDAE